MISGENIAQHILNPLEIKQNDISELTDLVKKYPYASTLHLLELKGLALANSIDFEAKLKSTAIHAPDRGHLFALIHSEAESVVERIQDVAVEEVIIKKTPVEETAVTELEEIPTEIAAAETKIEVEPEIETEAEVETAVAAEIESTRQSDLVAIDEDIAETTETPLEETLPIGEELAELDVDILNKAIDVAYVSSEIEKKAPIDVKETEFPEAIIPEILAAEEIILPTVTKENAALHESAEIEQGELTFIEWLRLKQSHQGKSLESTESLVTKETEKLKQEEIQEIVSSKAPNKEIEAEETSQADSEKRDINALLDKFMQEEPRISKPVKDFYNPVKSAQKSVEESDDMVTETLAKIHVLQKNYSKAISAYEKLILLYPEKKAFFASRIEKIREESKKR